MVGLLDSSLLLGYFVFISVEFVNAVSYLVLKFIKKQLESFDKMTHWRSCVY